MTTRQVSTIVLAAIMVVAASVAAAGTTSEVLTRASVRDWRLVGRIGGPTSGVALEEGRTAVRPYAYTGEVHIPWFSVLLSA